MRKVVATLAGIFFVLNVFNLSQATAFFGPSKCDKTKSKIVSLENKLNQKIRSLRNVGNLVPKDSPLITTVYANWDSLESSLLEIRKLGLGNQKCYNKYQLARLQVSDYWDKYYYVDVMQLDPFVAVTIRDVYFDLYGKTFRK